MEIKKENIIHVDPKDADTSAANEADIANTDPTPNKKDPEKSNLLVEEVDKITSHSPAKSSSGNEEKDFTD